MAAALATFHFCAWSTLPCTRPTRIGSPSARPLRCRRAARPQPPIAATTTAVATRGRQRSAAVRPVTIAAAATLTATTSAETPCTPTRLAAWAMGRTVPGCIPGGPTKPMKTCERPSSVATQTSGAAASPSGRTPESGAGRSGQTQLGRALNRDQREVDEHGHPQRQAAVNRHHPRDPVRAVKYETGGQSEKKPTPQGHARR